MATTAVSDLLTARRAYLEYPAPVVGEDPATRATKIVEWAKNNLLFGHPIRIRRVREWNLADRYVAADQWCLLSGSGIAPNYMATYVPEETDEDGIPMPVLDEFTMGVLNEAARLIRPDYEPSVRPSGTDPTFEARQGAKAATRALRQGLRDMEWDQTKRRAALHMPLYGGVWLKSYWRVSMDKTVRVPVENPMACPECEAVFAGPPPGGGMTCPNCPDHAAERPPTEEDKGARFEALDEFERAQPHFLEALDAPVAYREPGGPELQPRALSAAELSGVDALGRPLGRDVPLGEWRIDVLDPRDVHEAEYGIDANGDPVVRDVTIATVIHLDRLRDEWPAARSKHMKAEEEAALRLHHPLVGDRSAGAYEHCFRQHARRIERYKQPWLVPVTGPDGLPLERPREDGLTDWEYAPNQGKAVVVASDVVLQDADLMISDPAHPEREPFPRVLVVYVPHELASGGGERWGNSMAKRGFDMQDIINACASAHADERNWGMSRYVAPNGAAITFERDGRAAGVAYYEPNENLADGGKPDFVGGGAPSMKWADEMDYVTRYWSRASGQNQPERGEAPPGVTAAAALQLLREESAEHRRQRITAMGRAFERCYRHGLLLDQHYVKEPRLAWDKSDSQKEIQVWWSGADFEGQTDVKVDVEGASDTDALRSAKLQDSITSGVANVEDPRQRRIVGRLQGAPEELFQIEDLQESAAEREFQQLTAGLDPTRGEFTMGRRPVVDPSLDDHAAHADRHGRDFMSDKWRALEEAAMWDEVLPIIEPWQQQYEMSGGSGGMFGLAAGISSVQQGIEQLWIVLLMDAGREDLLNVPGANILLAGRAHREAHLWLARQAALAAMGGAPVMPAPGTEQAAAPAGASA